MKSGGWTIQTLNLGVHMSLRYEVALSGEMELKHVNMSRCIRNEKTTTNILQTNHNMAWSAVKDGCVY